MQVQVCGTQNIWYDFIHDAFGLDYPNITALSNTILYEFQKDGQIPDLTNLPINMAICPFHNKYFL